MVDNHCISKQHISLDLFIHSSILVEYKVLCYFHIPVVV